MIPNTDTRRVWAWLALVAVSGAGGVGVFKGTGSSTAAVAAAGHRALLEQRIEQLEKKCSGNFQLLNQHLRQPHKRSGR